MALGKNITPAQGIDYYEKDDYYLKIEGGPELALRWSGALAKEFGLSGKVDKETWKKALNGEFPNGIKINGGTFKDEDGNVQKRAGTDFVIEAPKTVSMLFAGTKDEALRAKILQIHERVTQKSLSVLEELALGRVRKGGGKREYQATGRFLAGSVTHLTNRDGGAFIHSHVVALNITKTSDGTYRSLNNEKMFDSQRFVKELAEAEYAKAIREELGIEIDKGKYGEVQLAGFTREQIEFSSSRVTSIDEFLRKRFGVEREHATPEQKDLAWDFTRKTKSVKEIEELETNWKDELYASGADLRIKEIEKSWGAQKELSEKKRLEEARESLRFAIEHHMEREASVREGELFRTALQAGRGKIGIEDLKKAVQEAQEKEEIIRQKGDGPKQNLMTSREAFSREKDILWAEKTGRGRVIPILNSFQSEIALRSIEKRDGLTLNEEQKAAARLILTTENRYVGINGYAGVGKTTMLKPAVEALKEAGYKVIGLGPQHSAVHALKEAGIIEARTLQSWLSDRKAGEDLGKVPTVVVIDEAGLASMKNIESAMRRIEKAGARAVFVGDVKQYESVEAGPAFRALQRNGMETVFVTEMQRQKKAAENVREAAKLSVSDPAKALEKLQENIREVGDPQERYKALSEEYLNSDPKETLVLTGTHEARKVVNDRVRESLGLKGRGQEFRTFQAEDKTKAELRRIEVYEAGKEVRFGKVYRSLGVKGGEIGKIEEVDRRTGTVRLRMEDGRAVTMTPRTMSGDGHTLGTTERMEFSKGDRIRITGNDLKKEGITNGMKGEVVESSPGGLRIRLDNGKEARLDGQKHLELAHGYAQTGHSAQGLGARKIIMDLPADSRTVNERSFYTNLTRLKLEVQMFTDNREKLTKAVSRHNDKTLAHDVEKANKAPEKPSTKEKSMNDQERAQRLTEQEKERLEKWKEGMKLRFPQERKDLGLKAGETVKVENIHKLSGIVVLRDQNGRRINLEPQWMKKAREERALKEIEALSNKAQGEEKQILQEKAREVRQEIGKMKETEARKDSEREKEQKPEKFQKEEIGAKDREKEPEQERKMEEKSDDRREERRQPEPERKRDRGMEMG